MFPIFQDTRERHVVPCAYPDDGKWSSQILDDITGKLLYLFRIVCVLFCYVTFILHIF